MKRAGLLTAGFVVAVAGAWTALFWWNNLRGAGPALEPPVGDIASQIETAPPPVEMPTGTTTVAVNGMPLTLPSGFGISIFAKQLKEPRVLATDPNGTLIVSVPASGKVVALPDADGNGVADRQVTVVAGLNHPHGFAFRCPSGQTAPCTLYVAETNAVATYDYDAATFAATNRRKIIDLPAGGVHITRTLLFHDDKLLIAVGSTCNVCRETNEQRAKILVANPDGSDLKEYAKGLRNAVFMVEHPATKNVWATEMGRDLLGDDTPPDEINVIEEGKNYGWPTCYGKNIHDTAFDKNTYIRNPCMEPFETPSLIDLQAHSAPLGLAFVPDGWPEDLRGDLLVAFHGSWNRTVPTGYKVVRMKLNADGSFASQEDFITGWLTKAGALGRPADLLFRGQDLYISDDKAGVIYRVARQTP